MTPNYLPKDFDYFVGMDVDKTSYSLTIHDHGPMSMSKRIPANPEQLYQYIHKRCGEGHVLFAYEAGPTGYGLYDDLTKRGQNCLVISPNTIPKAGQERVKNNRLDSATLTQQLKAGNLKSIRVPEQHYRALRHLSSLRQHYAKLSKQAKHRIKGLLLLENLYPHVVDDYVHWTGRYIKSLQTIPCPPAVRQRLDMLLMDLAYARRQLITTELQLKDFCNDQADLKRNIAFLRTIPGIGFITALTLLARIGDPLRLTHVRELAGFIGLTPREHSTGDKTRRGSICHVGDPYLRFLMVEAAWAAIRKDAELQKYYHRIRSKNHPSQGAKKAIVAVARKLTLRVFAVLKEQRNFIVR